MNEVVAEMKYMLMLIGVEAQRHGSALVLTLWRQKTKDRM